MVKIEPSETRWPIWTTNLGIVVGGMLALFCIACSICTLVWRPMYSINASTNSFQSLGATQGSVLRDKIDNYMIHTKVVQSSILASILNKPQTREYDPLPLKAYYVSGYLKRAVISGKSTAESDNGKTRITINAKVTSALVDDTPTERTKLTLDISNIMQMLSQNTHPTGIVCTCECNTTNPNALEAFNESDVSLPKGGSDIIIMLPEKFRNDMSLVAYLKIQCSFSNIVTS
jgi:hypothetical protein